MLLFNMASSFPLRETTRRVHVIPTSFPLHEVRDYYKIDYTSSRKNIQNRYQQKDKIDSHSYSYIPQTNIVTISTVTEIGLMCLCLYLHVHFDMRMNCMGRTACTEINRVGRIFVIEDNY